MERGNEPTPRAATADVDEPDEDGDLDERADDAGERLAGGGAQTPTATAIASSKSFEATVNAIVAVFGYPKSAATPEAKPMAHMIGKYTSSGRAIRTTSSGSAVIASPWIANSSTIVNSSPYSVIGAIRGMTRVSNHSRPWRRSAMRRVR